MNIRKSAGFTIVELVVVIVVIGILAAVALPRFLSLQDRAHDAVVEGTQAALASGVVMAKSVWLADGRDSALDDILAKPLAETCVNGATVAGETSCTALTTPTTTPVELDANIKGYPVSHSAKDGQDTANSIAATADSVACTEVFEFLLDDASVKATNLPAENTAGADSAFTFFVSATANGNCVYTYLPDNDPTTRIITYNTTNGTVVASGLSSSGTTSN